MSSRAGGVVAIAIVVAGLALAALTLRARDTAYTLPGAGRAADVSAIGQRGQPGDALVQGDRLRHLLDPRDPALRHRA